MGIHGLLPPAVFNQKQQIQRILDNFRRCTTDLDKYVYLTSLQDRNVKLFYAVLNDHIEEMAPIIYTPTVGQACQRFGLIFRRPRYVASVLSDTPVNANMSQNSYNCYILEEFEHRSKSFFFCWVRVLIKKN